MATILLAIDTDVERAEVQAESILELPLVRDDTQLVLFHVFRGDDEGADARKLNSVATALERLEAAGFDVEVEQSSGDAVREILAEAARVNADVVSLAGQKRSPTGKALFGSVSQDVVLESDRTVLLETTDD
ncbi:universal stress protein [Haladaptatus salinisoli]|uniref:universal stress protein n=1 Tax=Haladaptatus salinisoli TaxID=2884876 RepID=UPI001D0A0F97|nr:universal stress protein [Haladaptatus salinisoli]